MEMSINMHMRCCMSKKVGHTMWTRVLSTHVIEGVILNHLSDTVNEKPSTPLQAQRWSW
jgi:hypothetical protein